MHPAFKILANQNDITSKIADRLLALELHDEIGMNADSLTLRLDNRSPCIALPETGAILDVYLGYQETGLTFMGQFKVDNLELSSPPQALVIRARAAYFKDSFKAPKTRSFDNITLQTLATAIAIEHGYNLALSPQLAQHTFEHLDQTHESDLNLLTRLSRDLGATIKPVAGKLLIKPRGENLSVSGLSLPVMTITQEQIKSYRLTISDRGRYKQVTARWYDVQSGEEKEVTTGTEKPTYPIRRVFSDVASAKKAAEAKLKLLQMGEMKLTLDLIGMPNLTAESRLLLQTTQSEINHNWLIITSGHCLDSNGYSTSVYALCI